ncbi:hypothetical protein JR316_0006216 [Psilocybe cubensis]|uniref:Uncharacterized protein n=2 Tax=Psilocybe cubensis TaxID=181762 RepID=A0A8H7Y3I1_PSICU|nr:hypothetical protein JR316_0006216 [Psilocybe cubensis]KAH9481689.1 hypothetical protein JR316_0006216 [Psilocybe cubensis]
MNVYHKRILSNFYKLLENTPWIGHYILRLSLSVDVVSLTKLIPPALEAFAHITRLQDLTLEIGTIDQRASWNSLSTSVQCILQRFIRLPTIDTLTLVNIYDIPAIDMTSRKRLDFLTIIGPVSFHEEHRKDTTALSSAPKLLGLAYSPRLAQPSLNIFTKGKPPFDLGELKYFCCYWAGIDEFYRLLFENSPNLQNIHICIRNGFHDQPTGLGHCLSFSLHSLVNLYINVDPYFSFLGDEESNSLFKLCLELREIARDNRIEYLSIRLLLQASSQREVEEIPWGRLDNLLLVPNTWTTLKQCDLWVYLDQDNHYGSDINSETFLTAARNVQESQLSRLISNKSFKFNSFFNVGSKDYFVFMGVTH